MSIKNSNCIKEYNICINKNIEQEKNVLINNKKHYKIELTKRIVFKSIKLYEKLGKSSIFGKFLTSVSIILRIDCIIVLSYVILVMINETDSWLPLVNFLFCFGIILDLIYFIHRKKEHTG
jgi:hypothetical protein